LFLERGIQKRQCMPFHIRLLVLQRRDTYKQVNILKFYIPSFLYLQLFHPLFFLSLSLRTFTLICFNVLFCCWLLYFVNSFLMLLLNILFIYLFFKILNYSYTNDTIIFSFFVFSDPCWNAEISWRIGWPRYRTE